MNLAVTCHKHGGPVNVANLEILDYLTNKELSCEVSYLKASFDSEIKLKNCVKEANSLQYKMVNLLAEQLKQSIWRVLKPLCCEEKMMLKLYWINFLNENSFKCMLLYFSKFCTLVIKNN